jgi:hypothetical protein
MTQIETPVALFVYRRPEHTKKVITQIKKANPPQVLIVGDGPADAGEQSQVNTVRRVVADTDWDCEIMTNYSDTNLGLKNRFATGLDWVFSNVSEAIILEDDTVPESSFFHFCDVLLDRFRGDDRVWEITGRNELGTYSQGKYSYHYSLYGGIWGWATWKSSFEEYDPEMSDWENSIVRDQLRDLLVDEDQYEYVRDIYNQVYKSEIITWDYQWGFARHRNGAVSIVPETNLVTNIGFDEQATNTTSGDRFTEDTSNIEFPLSHPPFVIPDREYDRQYHGLRKNKIGKVIYRLKKLFSNR